MQVAFDFSGIQRDSLNRLVSYTDSFGNQVAYTYDAAGQLTSMTLPGGNTVTYQYDHAHRLSQVSDWLGNFALYRYDAAGWPLSVTVSGGPIAVYQYDAAHNLRAIVSTGPDGSPVAGYRYTLDGNANRTAVSALEPFTAAVSFPAYSVAYDAANHPVTRSDGQSYTYDSRGNLTAIQGSRNVTLGYDAFGRLQSFNAGTSTTYGYDSTGLRVVRTVDGTARLFLYDLVRFRAARGDGDGRLLHAHRLVRLRPGSSVESGCRQLDVLLSLRWRRQRGGAFDSHRGRGERVPLRSHRPPDWPPTKSSRTCSARAEKPAGWTTATASSLPTASISFRNCA